MPLGQRERIELQPRESGPRIFPAATRDQLSIRRRRAHQPGKIGPVQSVEGLPEIPLRRRSDCLDRDLLRRKQDRFREPRKLLGRLPVHPSDHLSPRRQAELGADLLFLRLSCERERGEGRGSGGLGFGDRSSL